MQRKFAAFALALALSLLGVAGAAIAPHYSGDPVNTETAVRDYETPSVSAGVLAVALHLDDPAGVTGDGSIDAGGVIFPACSPDNNEGTFNYGLRCAYTDDTDGDGTTDPMPDGPYDEATISVTDEVSQNIKFDATTCSVDGDNFCGETNNTDGGAQPSTPGPNELSAEACTPDSAVLERNPNDPRDGTGDGVWNQTDEMYDFSGDGSADTPHPGVDALSVFLWDPLNEALGEDLCDGPAQDATTGTITVVGR